MKFLIQQNLINQNHLARIEEATRNYPREFVSIIPYTTEIISNEELIGNDYIPYGSSLLTKISLDKEFNGLYFNNNFNYETFMNNRKDMLNAGVVVRIDEVENLLKLRHAVYKKQKYSADQTKIINCFLVEYLSNKN